MACADGEVRQARPWGDWGNYVTIYHHRAGVGTGYAHLDEIAVSVGQRVAQGEIIGLSGETGKAFGPHLHFEVFKEGKRVDPAPYLGLPPGPG